jgi:hypothetical protein
MAARAMGGMGEVQVKNASPDGTFLSSFHAPGTLGHIMVAPTLYKMRGYNAGTSSFEFWLTDNPNAGPPTGANLTNKTISAILVNPNLPKII